MSRSSDSCGRSSICLQEDSTLLAILEDSNFNEHEPSWTMVAALMGSTRTGKQCRDRYLNHLRDGIKKGSWTVDEESLLKDLHDVFGPRCVREFHWSRSCFAVPFTSATWLTPVTCLFHAVSLVAH